MKSKVIIPLATTLIVSVSIVLTIFVGFSKPTINDVVLDENIEALSQSDNPGMFDDQTAWFSILSHGLQEKQALKYRLPYIATRKQENCLR